VFIVLPEVNHVWGLCVLGCVATNYIYKLRSGGSATNYINISHGTCPRTGVRNVVNSDNQHADHDFIYEILAPASVTPIAAPY